MGLVLFAVVFNCCHNSILFQRCRLCWYGLQDKQHSGWQMEARYRDITRLHR